MKLKRLVRYQMDISGKWADLSAALMGAAFFMQALFFFLIRDISACSGGEITFRLILPLLAAAVWMQLLRVFQLRDPAVFGIVGAALCLLLAIQGFYGGNGFFAVIGLIWYLACAVAVVFVCFGYLPYRILLFVLFLSPAVLQGFVVLGKFIIPGNYWQGLPDYAVILVHISLACLSTMLRPVKKG